MRVARRLRLALLAATLAACPALQAAAQEVVLVPARVIYPGETIDIGALKPVTLKTGRTAPDEMATTADALEGKVARRTLLPGRYIAATSLREAWLVEQGASVQVLFVSGGLTITATAVTLQHGSAGDVVKLRNLDSGKIISGTVMADGTVRVGST